MKVTLKVTSLKSERFLITVIALAIAIKSYSLHFHDLGFDRMAFRDYIARAALKGWLDSDWFVGGNNTWVPTFSQWPITILESIFGTYLGGFILALIVSLCTAHTLYSLFEQLTHKTKSSIASRLIATSISLLAPYWLGELGTSYENSLTTPIVLFGLLNLLKFNQDSEKAKFVFIASFMFTFATTLKMTNMVFLVPGLFLLGLVISINVKSFRNRIKAFGFLLLGTSAGLTIIVPWWIYTFQNMRNPIFPFFNTLFHSPYHPAENFRDPRWVMDSLFDLKSMISGWQLEPAMSELPFIDPRFPILFGVLIIVVIRRVEFSRIKFHRIIPFSAGVLLQLWVLISVLLWARILFYARYLQPVELLLGILVVYYLTFILSSRRLINVASTFILIISVLFIQIPSWGSNSEGSLFGGRQERWASPLTEEVSKFQGILLTTGATGFLRQTSPEISNMINLDSYLLPERYSILVQNALAQGETVNFVSQGAAKDAINLKSRIYQIFGDKILVNVECKDAIGPIYGPFVICRIRPN